MQVDDARGSNNEYRVQNANVVMCHVIADGSMCIL